MADGELGPTSHILSFNYWQIWRELGRHPLAKYFCQQLKWFQVNFDVVKGYIGPQQKTLIWNIPAPS